jgi:hypothetical protein
MRRKFMKKEPNRSEIILYKTEDGAIKIDTIFQDENIWLTQSGMAELFDVKIPAISKHLKNIFEEGELQKEATLSKMETVQNEGGRQITRNKDFYNLDAIIAVGYRVNSKRKIADAKKADEDDLKELDEIEKKLLENKNLNKLREL